MVMRKRERSVRGGLLERFSVCVRASVCDHAAAHLEEQVEESRHWMGQTLGQLLRAAQHGLGFLFLRTAAGAAEAAAASSMHTTEHVSSCRAWLATARVACRVSADERAHPEKDMSRG